MKSVFVDHLILYDHYEFDFSKTDGCITLGVSKDDKVHFSELFNEVDLTKTALKSTLRLKNYQGIVLIPTNTALQINNTSKIINGKIGTSAHIDTDGDINLEISKESGLELCLTTTCEVKINNIISRCINSERMREPVLTRSYNFFEQKYMNYIKNNPKIINKSTFLIMDMCLHYNLLYIKKDNGKLSLQYTPPKLESKTDIELHDKNNTCRSLRRDILLASNEGKIYKAAYKKTELDRVLAEIYNIHVNISNNSTKGPNSQKLEQ